MNGNKNIVETMTFVTIKLYDIYINLFLEFNLLKIVEENM